jgi:type IV fimbrial biogenesis protein FimT
MVSRGLTVVELMIVLVIIGVMAALAAPSFTDQFARRRLEGVATDLSTDLQFARSQAVSSRADIALVTRNSGTEYAVQSGGVDMKVVTLPANVTATNGVTVTFQQLRGDIAAAQQIDLASSVTAATMRLNVGVMGRVSVCSPSGSLKGYTSC